MRPNPGNKYDTRSETEAELGAGGGKAKNPLQSCGRREARGEVAGAAEGCRAEANEADRSGAGEYAAEQRSDPLAAGEGAAES